MSSRLALFLTTAFASKVFAHGIIGEFITDGFHNDGFPTDAIYRIQNGKPVPNIAAWSTEALDRGYIEPNSVGTLDINCHKNAAPSVLTAKVAAGGTVDFVWPDWPHNVGPVLTYIASCGGDCATADKFALKWVKIDEAGFDGTWAGQKLMDNDFTWTTTVPSTIAPGNYVFRNEIINLHDGATKNGAQLYPQCMNIEIVGSGTDTPAGVLGIELYKADDAGILFDPYADDINYTPPGPPLYTPGSSGTSAHSNLTITSSTPLPTQTASNASMRIPATSAVDSTLASTPVPTTLATRTCSSVIPAGTSDSNTVPLYKQCGGKGYTGPTTCAPGSVCKLYGATHSRCVPA